MPAETEFGAQPLVKIDGRALDGPIEMMLEEVVVHDHLHLPDMLELRFRDEEQELLANARAKVGSTVEVAATGVGRDAADKPLFKGEITALETEYEAASGSHAVVRGYDKSHRLMKLRKTRAWNEVTLGELARELAGEASISVGAVDSTFIRYEYVAQVNETNWEFLQRLALESGYEVSTELGTLQLRRPPPADTAPAEADVRVEAQPLQLVLGTNLRSLRVRVTAASQVEEVTVRSWDWKTKKEMVGQAPARTSSVQVQDKPAQLAARFKATPSASVTHTLDSQAQVDAAAKSLAELVAAASAEAYGVVDGNPTLKAGEAVSISNAGASFDGKYLVTASRHVFDEEGFRSHFEITGRQVRSVLGLVSSGQADEDSRFFGVVIAIVTNNKDEEGNYRVKLKFPWLDGNMESGWARVATLDAGSGQRGALFLPEVNDEVLVAFEHGDFRRPFVVGRLWNGVDKPPEIKIDGSGKVEHREYRSRLGHILRFSDKDGDSHIELVQRRRQAQAALRRDEEAGRAHGRPQHGHPRRHR